MSPLELENISDEELENALARDDFGFFCEYVHRGGYTPAPHTEHIARKLEQVERGEVDRLLVLLPPRHSKSMTITETFPAWFIGKDPERRVILTAYGDSLARTFGRRNLRKLQEYAEPLFGLELEAGERGASSVAIAGHRGGIISAGIGGAITGQGADLLIVDDPVKNWQEATSSTYRERVWHEWQNTLLTRLHPGGRVVIVMTHWHHDDLAGRLLDREGDRWDVVRLPAIAEDTDDALGREVGEALWPEYGFDLDHLHRTHKTVGSRVWNALFQQRPAPVQGALFQRDWFQFYSTLPPVFEEVIQSWDCSFKDSASSSYVVGQVWGRVGSSKYLIAQTRKQMGFVETVNAVKQKVIEFPETKAILIEDKANGTAVIETLKAHISRIIPVEPRGGKEARATSITPEFEAGNVYLPEYARWVEDYIEELVEFPLGSHDDQVDATSQALMRLQGRKKFQAVPGVFQ